MKIIGFIWYEKIIEKLEQKHNVRQYEVREVFENNPKFRYVEKGLQLMKMCMRHSGGLSQGDI